MTSLSMFALDWFTEPRLLFRYDQRMESPRDGLTLFGPLDDQPIYGMRVGVIGRKAGREFYRHWVQRLSYPILPEGPDLPRYAFPGFEEVFGVKWSSKPAIEIDIPEEDLNAVLISDPHQRVFKTVSLFADRINETVTNEEVKVDIWFVVIPDDVYRYCRPLSRVEKDLQIDPELALSKRRALSLQHSPSLFADDNRVAQAYAYDADFHNQLKARLLESRQVVQVAKESTLAPRMFPNLNRARSKNFDRFEAEVAWNMGTAAFYKAGGRPWKIADVRPGVCYVGLVFKRDERNADPRAACCAAQMFLDSGDGMVFKGAVGPWYNPDHSNYHLSKSAARDLVKMTIAEFSKISEDGKPPKELFIHGRVRFNDDEWTGFKEAAGDQTNVVGVRIHDGGQLRLFRLADHPVIRGASFIEDDRHAYLWTRGFTPRLQTYPGREVPKPLYIEITKGTTDVRTVVQDILALTKLNYNTANFADGVPVTLRFADAVGEILTAGPLPQYPPLPFRHYI